MLSRRLARGAKMAVGAGSLMVLAGCGTPASAECGVGGRLPLGEVAATLAYSCEVQPHGRYGNREVFVLSTQAGSARSLTPSPSWDVDPAWSPDGSRLAFSSTRDGVLNLYTIDARGGKPRRVTAILARDFEPTWSPDGRRIAFTSGRGGVHGPLGPVGLRASIYLMQADGSGVTRLTDSPGYDGDPAWSPDGSTLAFVSDRGGEEDVWTISMGARRLAQLTFAGGVDRPAWSPDGTRMAFSRASAGDGDHSLYVMNADGSGQHRLLAGDGMEPAWSPDGGWIAFVSERGGSRNLYLARSDGSGITQLTRDPAPKYRPTWRPR